MRGFGNFTRKASTGDYLDMSVIFGIDEGPLNDVTYVGVLKMWHYRSRQGRKAIEQSWIEPSLWRRRRWTRAAGSE